MPEISPQQAKLQNLLRELFQLDQPDLDFGLYRIMHAKSAEIERFLNEDLLATIQQRLGGNKAEKVEQAKVAYERKKQAVIDDDGDPDTSKQVQQTLAEYKAAQESQDDDAELYDHLYKFFERYYEGGDFLSRRYYARETSEKAAPYAVPYDGSEVYLHWANKDQYYIKTAENFRQFTVDLAQAKTGETQLFSGKGFVFEYSATFAQAVKAAKNEAVTQAYAKSVLFDYSYRYFYEDGYGKDYQVFNLADSRFDAWHTERLYLTASLLSFYQQLRVFDEQRAALAGFNLEKPLWVFVGASVTKASGGKKEEEETATDVRNIVQFIADFLHDWQQSETDIQHVLDGAVVDGNGNNLFEHSFAYLQDKRHAGESATQLHQDVLARLFGGGGLLRLTRVSGETAEIRLHTGEASKPFGLVNVGDAPGLMKELEKCLNVQVEESQFASGALFGEISGSTSPVNVLIGSRKFIAGWDCWRVSTLGLMNIGKSEGSQIIQLFGRGVRLKGRDWSLKRSSKLAHATPPKHIQIVETLGVFGVKADYMQQFQQMLEDEGLPGNQRRAEKIIPMNVVHDFGKRLMVLAPMTKRADGREYDFSLDAAVPLLNATVPDRLIQNPVTVDCYPRFQSVVAGAAQAVQIAPQPVFLTAMQLTFVDWDALWLELERYKRLRGFTHLVIEKACLPTLFDGNHHGWYALLMPPRQMAVSWENVAIWKKVALELLKRYVEAFYNHHKKAFFEPRLELVELTGQHPNLLKDEYHLSWETTAQADQDQVLRDVEKLEQDIAQARAGIVPHDTTSKLRAAVTGMQLLKPLLYAQDSRITVTPVPLNDSEFDFVRDLNTFLESKPEMLAGAEVYLLRNKTRGGGVGFFEAGAFYPDFIVWVLRGGKQYVAFVEPHGLRNETPHTPKLKFYATIKEIEARVNQGRADPILLDSFIVSPTRMHELKWGDGWQTLDEFGKRHVLMMKDEPDGYVGRMFGMLLSA
ncbi:MAG: hypothetical protein Q8O37_17515 [Sulfuricellaceae bacterium]|nr:hypothetical protein [Sulfuricellaceae bacterium]